MRKVSVVGNSGAGQSTLARQLAERLDVPYVELDAIHHLPGWQPIDPTEFRSRVADIAAEPGWVIDGNYRAVVVDGPVWEHADTVVWVDPPRRRVMRQVIGRSLRRVFTREVLWNGNREPARNLLRWSPERNIVRWAWTNHDKYRHRFSAAMTDPHRADVQFVRLRSPAEIRRWLATLPPAVESPPAR